MIRGLHLLFLTRAFFLLGDYHRFLKDSTDPKYSVGQVNAYPTTTYAIWVVTTLAYASGVVSSN